MLAFALIFLIAGVIAGAIGLAWAVAVASHAGWILFLIGVVLLVIYVIRHVPPAA